MDDSQIKEILENQVLTVVQAVEDKLDEEIAALDRLDLDDIEVLRERRLQQMKKMAEKRSRWMSLGHGEHTEISEKDFFAAAKASERLVCHFYRENWPCKVMDKHLNTLAKQHIETRFVKVHAEKSPFLTERLRVVVLPTLALVKNAKVDDYVVGFDELGGTDEFSTEELEERLAKAKVIYYEGAKQKRAGAIFSSGWLSFYERVHDGVLFMRLLNNGASNIFLGMHAKLLRSEGWRLQHHQSRSPNLKDTK